MHAGLLVHDPRHGEWASGYAKRFGLFRTDYATLQRRAKDSAHWYREFIAAHAKQRAGGA
jgi:beta-glucosidase